MKIILLAFLFCVSLTGSNPAADVPWRWKSPRHRVDVDPSRSSSRGTDTRIVNGNEAIPHAWPHQVALFIDDTYFCGGTLISDQWVLTAAHCLDGAGSAILVMGAHNIRKHEESQVTTASNRFYLHEDWRPFPIVNDIALVSLDDVITFNENISSARLPAFDVDVGTLVTATGWGFQSNGGDFSNVLRQVDVSVISNDDCEAEFGEVGKGVVCTDSTGGKGTCQGDSGGPLILSGTTYGITSFGSSNCNDNLPDAYTRVHHYLDWIEAKTGITP